MSGSFEEDMKYLADRVCKNTAFNLVIIFMFFVLLNFFFMFFRDKHKTASEKKRYLSQQLQQSTKNREPKVCSFRPKFIVHVMSWK